MRDLKKLLKPFKVSMIRIDDNFVKILHSDLITVAVRLALKGCGFNIVPPRSQFQNLTETLVRL